MCDELRFLEQFLADTDRHGPRFVERYGVQIEQLVRGSSVPYRNWEDVLQDVYFELMRNDLARLRQWDPEIASFRVFLRVVVSHIIVDLVRGPTYRELPAKDQEADGEDAAAGIAAPQDSPRDCARNGEFAERVEQALAELIESGQAQPLDVVIFRQKCLGADARSIARLVDSTENAVNIRYHRLNQNLRGLLKRRGIDENDITKDR